MGGWTKRDPVSNLVILGDDEGNARKAGGLLAKVSQDTMYPNRMNYELVQKDGASIMLAGSASLGRQIAPSDVGRFVKCEFKGWGKSANGKFKEIEVLVFDGTPTDEMKKWPRWAEINAPKAAQPAPDFSDFPPEPAPGEDDDLPFDGAR